MTNLAAFKLAAWFIVLVSSIQLVHACFGCVDLASKSSRIKQILQMDPEERDFKQTEKLFKAARKAFSGKKIISIETALEIFRDKNGQAIVTELEENSAQALINISTVTREKCDDKNLISKDFPTALTFVIKNKRQFSALYKHVKASLGRFTAECGLQERYKKIVHFLSSESGQSSADKKSTLADQLLGGSFDSPESISVFSHHSWMAIQLLRDPKFTNEIKCSDKETIAEISVWFRVEYFEWAREYVHHVLGNYLEACGYEKRFKLVADTISRETASADKTLAAFLEWGVGIENAGMVLLALDLTWLIATGKQDCDKIGSQYRLNEEIREKGYDRESALGAYPGIIIEHNKSLCGFELF